MDERTRDEVAAFLRRWLPAEAQHSYRRMIERDPDGWSLHPHFRSGFFVRQMLRGNGFTAQRLGVESLDHVWAELLAHAVMDDGT